MDCEFNVNAYLITKFHVYYECPYCLTIRTGRHIENTEENRKKYKSAKPTVHTHGSEGKFHNRIIERITHCRINTKMHPLVNVTDSTKRKYD